MAKSDITLGDAFAKFKERGIGDMLDTKFGKARPFKATGDASGRVEIAPDTDIPFERIKFDTAFVGERGDDGKVIPIENGDALAILAASNSITAKIKRDKLEKAYRGGNSLPVSLGIVADNGGKGIERIIVARGSLNLGNAVRALNGELGTRATRGDNLAELASEL